MSSLKRLLDPELIPNTLWDATSKTLLLPSALSRVYRILIDRHGLQKLAESRDLKNPPVGGLTQEETDKHFAQAFDGSVARTELALLDPNQDIPHASNAFINCLAGNKVCLTDAPCGAGAAALSFISGISELRAQSVLPRQPLDIILVGAELSGPARAYAEEFFVELRPALESQAIFVKAKFQPWDATNKLSNTDFIRQMILASEGENTKRLLIISNFN